VRRWPWMLTALLVTLATRIYYCEALRTCAEDAYITFRYAENFGRGLGPVFNIGEKVWGATSPLWMTILAALSAGGIGPEWSSRAILLVCDMVTVWLLWRALAPRGLTAALIGAGLFALWPASARLPAAGLEAPLMAMLLVAGAVGPKRFRAVSTGLLALCRPEGVLMALVLCLRLSWRQRAVAASLAALWLVPMLYYHALLPAPVMSKSIVYTATRLIGWQWFEWFTPAFWGRMPFTLEGRIGMPLALLLAPGIFVGFRQEWRSGFGVLAAAGLMLSVAYWSVTAIWFYWYAGPIYPALFALGAIGIASMRLPKPVMVALTVYMVTLWAGPAVALKDQSAYEMEILGPPVQWLGQQPDRATASILLEPIGIVGWVTGMKVLDEVGLVSPWIAGLRKQGDGWYYRVIQQDKPTYLLFRYVSFMENRAYFGAGGLWASAAQKSEVLRSYKVVWPESLIPESLITVSNSTMVIMRRNDAP
jgi:arabinofuranosyltransferase